MPSGVELSAAHIFNFFMLFLCRRDDIDGWISVAVFQATSELCYLYCLIAEANRCSALRPVVSRDDA